ncbi:MAG: spermidine/putrescine ABC transporter substrate-binding protein [Blastochloris sp.]|nr:spermidine/putrescine ABC transporter substrate-binding protein [Blastochloris sp.]
MKRTQLACLALASILALTFSACSPKSSDPTASGKPTTGSKQLNLFAWSEYVPQAIIDDFTKETGIKVNYETYASNEEMVSKLVAGATPYDLVMPSEYTVEALLKANKLAPLDLTQIPNIKNIAPEYTNLAHDPGFKYSVPWMSGSVGIVVNTEKITDPVTGYADFFQEKHKGRIVVLNDNREMVSWVLNTLGLSINDVSPANLEKVRPILAGWIKMVKVFDSDSPKTALLNGDVDLGIVWSGEAAILYKENKKFKYTLPKEGAHRFIDSLAIPVGSPHADAAHLFINYILRPEVSVIISQNFPYTNPNLEARKLLTPEELGNPASYPADSSMLETFRDIGMAAADIDKLVTDLKSSN